MGFAERFGPWALVLGASEGIGLALARGAAERGLDLVLVGRRPAALDAAAAGIRADYGRAVRALALDLAAADAADRVAEACAGLEVGLVAYNAALAPNRAFLDCGEAELADLVGVNLRSPTLCLRRFGAPMAERGRGGLLLMSSLASMQGSGWLAAYAASKAYLRVLAEGLWAELRHSGVRAACCLAGSTATPNFKASGFARSAPAFPPVQDPAAVARAALRYLERGRGPAVVPGWANRASARLMAWLPRRLAVGVLSHTARRAQAGR